MLHWYAGPWIWTGSGRLPRWRPPLGCAGLDLRSLPDQSRVSGTPGFGVFWGKIPHQSLESTQDYTHLGSGSWYDLRPTGAVRAAIPRRRGYSPKGDDLAGLILDLLTAGADPDGLDGPAPLAPAVEGRLELHCGQRHHERFRWGSGHTPALKQMLRRQFAGLMADAEAGRLNDRQQHRRVLDYWCDKYGVADWREFVPGTLQSDVPGRLPHQTTITDSFDRADQTGLGTAAGGWSWSAALENTAMDIVSNKAEGSTQVNGVHRAETDLSSSDHYARATVRSSSTTGGKDLTVLTRFAGSALTHYFFHAKFGDSAVELYKRVAGTYTQIGSTVASMLSADTDYPLKGQSNGSTHQLTFNGIQEISQTDTAIAGNTRTGLRWSIDSGAGIVRFDAFEAADLAVAGITYTQLERGTRGLLRGLWTGRA